MSLNDNEDLRYIKQHYGEEFAKMCRSTFPTLLEQKGLLSRLISEHIEPTKTFMQDIMLEENSEMDCVSTIKNYIYSFVNVEKKEDKKNIAKTAQELFSEAGYILMPECMTEEDIQSYKHYYAKDEKLCTFNGNRLKSNRVWFAIKKEYQGNCLYFNCFCYH